MWEEETTHSSSRSSCSLTPSICYNHKTAMLMAFVYNDSLWCLKILFFLHVVILELIVGVVSCQEDGFNCVMCSLCVCVCVCVCHTLGCNQFVCLLV